MKIDNCNLRFSVLAFVVSDPFLLYPYLNPPLPPQFPFLLPPLSVPNLRVGLGTEFRSEKIPRNRLGTVSVIPRKKLLIPRHSEFRGRASSEARNETERNGTEFRGKI
jgi:hypothetical protein